MKYAVIKIEWVEGIPYVFCKGLEILPKSVAALIRRRKNSAYGIQRVASLLGAEFSIHSDMRVMRVPRKILPQRIKWAHRSM